MYSMCTPYSVATYICSEAFTNMAALKNHVMKHLNNELEYSCGVCNKLYKPIEEAKDHAMKVCGIIQEKRGQSEQKKRMMTMIALLAISHSTAKQH